MLGLGSHVVEVLPPLVLNGSSWQKVSGLRPNPYLDSFIRQAKPHLTRVASEKGCGLGPVLPPLTVARGVEYLGASSHEIGGPDLDPTNFKVQPISNFLLFRSF